MQTILCCVSFQRVLELDLGDIQHECVDKAGFNLNKKRRCGRNIRQRAVDEVAGWSGGNITMCAAISMQGVLHNHAVLAPYNIDHFCPVFWTLCMTLFFLPQQEK